MEKEQKELCRYRSDREGEGEREREIYRSDHQCSHYMLIQAASWLPGLWPCFWGGSPGVAGSLQWALRHLELWCHHVCAWGWVSRVRPSDAVSDPSHEVHHIAREISGNIPTYPHISPNIPKYPQKIKVACLDVPWCALCPRLSISCVMPCLSDCSTF